MLKGEVKCSHICLIFGKNGKLKHWGSPFISEDFYNSKEFVDCSEIDFIHTIRCKGTFKVVTWKQ